MRPHYSHKLILFTLLAFCVGCTLSPNSHIWSEDIDGQVMGTTFVVKVWDEGKRPSGFHILNTAYVAFNDVDRRMSTYKDDSEISRFNRYDGTDWFDVSKEMALVVQEALEISRRTDGAFDPTIGPLVRLWNFGPDRRKVDQKPSDVAINMAVLTKVGYQKIKVQVDPPAIRKTDPHVELDLSAIAKGYAVDQLAKQLDRLAIKNYMVEVGGEVRVRGLNKKKKPWRIAIERPDSHERSIQTTVDLTDQSMATSGDYRNYFEKDGVRYSHLLDPTTGRPIRHKLVSVSVRTPTCTEADALATGLIVLGPERAEELARKEKLDVTLIVRDGDRFVVQEVKPKETAQ